MIFGDTRHTAGQSYNYLNGSSKDGLFPRPDDQLAGMNEYASVLRNWCPDTDPICAQGDIVETHLNYFDIYSDEAGAWVREMVEKASDGESTSTSKTSSASATSSQAEETTTEETTTEAETTSETTEAAQSTTTEGADAESTSTDVAGTAERSEEHTSELQSLAYLVC